MKQNCEWVQIPQACLVYGVLSLTGKALAWKAGSNRSNGVWVRVPETPPGEKTFDFEVVYMRLDVNEFQKHVDSMTDEEVRESIEKALRMTSGLNQDDWTISSNESDPTFKNNK